MANEGQQLAENLFMAVRSNDTSNINTTLSDLAKIDRTMLKTELDTDEEKFAFWINIYNSHIQYFLKKNPELYNDRNAFFKEKRIIVAGERLSFDLIEHGILRKSVIKISLGYLSKCFVRKFEKDFRVKHIDPRLHFALNCGAKSCPIMRLYTSSTLNEELDQNTVDYLSLNVFVESDKIIVPSLFSWFRGDFGGKKGIRKFLEKYKLVTKEDRNKKIVFSEYDWTLDLN